MTSIDELVYSFVKQLKLADAGPEDKIETPVVEMSKEGRKLYKRFLVGYFIVGAIAGPLIFLPAQAAN